MGESKRTQGRFNYYSQTQDLAGRSKENRGCAKGEMGEMAKGETNSLKDMVTDTQWRGLTIELQKEIEAVLASFGEIVLIESLNESGSELMLSNRTATLKTIKDVPEPIFTFRLYRRFVSRNCRNQLACLRL
jgi:hypothetical protein